MIHPLTLTLDNPLLKSKNIRIAIYRGDLEHKQAPGNKWHKLKFNLEAAKAQGAKQLISFGGPYSNHLHALGNIALSYAITPIAIVRGELHPQLTPTLRDFVKAGGILWPSKRIDYRAGMESELVADLKAYYPEAYWVPEGGSNSLGVKGCCDWAQEIHAQAQALGEFDTWVVSAGTGATSAGFLAYETKNENNSPDVLVFPALKGGEGLLDDIQRFALTQNPQTDIERLKIIGDYHHGGYAKLPQELKDYIEKLHLLNPELKLDPVYTAKVVYGLEQEIIKGHLDNRNLLLIHTGGLQGWSGYQ
ncbi:MAG: 1-aminocyclopropane-1-carboxylate deaminase/D-cysteine desulfhydrase [Marinomonas sp.]|jgi:1-aminocyclopropane-1-carboxylate deaminase|uniref:1-aminocyclopropane-1-carboxylate deaminase/D-cysteine desulfhydrase n=1 Tax=unclassified Marinomonas TaxID=196814 RepID=UPI0007AEF59F|nr:MULTISPECIES: pyridoxal-phosphate dependent enzyme [unclassified Marinomonas]